MCVEAQTNQRTKANLGMLGSKEHEIRPPLTSIQKIVGSGGQLLLMKRTTSY